MSVPAAQDITKLTAALTSMDAVPFLWHLLPGRMLLSPWTGIGILVLAAFQLVTGMLWGPLPAPANGEPVPGWRVVFSFFWSFLWGLILPLLLLRVFIGWMAIRKLAVTVHNPELLAQRFGRRRFLLKLPRQWQRRARALLAACGIPLSLAIAVLGVAAMAMGGIALFLLLGTAAAIGYRTSLELLHKLTAMSVEEALASDRRPPILFLRAFNDDGLRDAKRWWVLFFVARRFEESLAMRLGSLGPIIAIGRPGERLPEAGAAREYVSDAEWKARVGLRASQSRMVLLVMGTTEGLGWEIGHLRSQAFAGRAVILLPPVGDDEYRLRQTQLMRLLEISSEDWQVYTEGRKVVAVSLEAGQRVTFLTCDHSKTDAYVAAILMLIDPDDAPRSRAPRPAASSFATPPDI